MELKGKIPYLLYYGFLVLVVMFWSTSAVVVPPTPLRLLFLLAVFFPVRNDMVALFAVEILFFAISYFGLSYFMPSEYHYYFIIFLLFLFVNKNDNPLVPPAAMVVLLLSSLAVGLVNIDTSSTGSFFHRLDSLPQCLIVLLVLCALINKDDENTNNYFSYAFIIASLVLALVQLLFGSAFRESYFGSDFDRNVWTDPNYFGMGVGIGCVVAFVRLASTPDLNWKEKTFLLGVWGIGLLSILLNASRGAVLAVAAPSAIIVLFSKIQKKYKILLVVALAALVVVFNYLNVFDFLVYRIKEDDGTGSMRSEIWAMKILYFSQQDLASQIFGIGYQKGLSLGHYVMAHNDYVAFLVEFGYLGLFCFFLLLYYPLRFVKFKSEGFPVLLSFVLYIAICSMSLEIYTTGNLVFWFFYLYILYMKQFLKNKEMV